MHLRSFPMIRETKKKKKEQNKRDKEREKAKDANHTHNKNVMGRRLCCFQTNLLHTGRCLNKLTIVVCQSNQKKKANGRGVK